MYPKILVILLLLYGVGCAKGLAEPVRPEATKTIPAETVPEPINDGLKPVKHPQIEECFLRHATTSWQGGEISRDYVISIKFTVEPLDMRVAPTEGLELEAMKTCLLKAIQEIDPDTILFATGVRLHQHRQPSAIPMIQGGLTPLQVREGIIRNGFGRCLEKKQYEIRLHGAAILKGEIVNGELVEPRVHASTFQDPEYEACVAEKMKDLRFEVVPEPSTLNYPLSMRISDLDP